MSNQRQSEKSVRTYLSPLYARFVKGHAVYTGESESRIVADAVKRLYESTPELEREKILRCSKNTI
jgi:hypothetical protein